MYKRQSINGTLRLKQLATAPDWPSVITEKLWTMGIRPNDKIAVIWTGSIPGANLALAAAASAMKLDVVAINSLCSSQYGANIEEMTWLHIEKKLFEANLIEKLSIAASRGGRGDCAQGNNNTALIDNIIDSLGYERIVSHRSVDGIFKRLELFSKNADQNLQNYKGIINIGGSDPGIGGDFGLITPSGIIQTKDKLPADSPHSILTHLIRAYDVPGLNLRWLPDIFLPKEFEKYIPELNELKAYKVQHGRKPIDSTPNAKNENDEGFKLAD